MVIEILIKGQLGKARAAALRPVFAIKRLGRPRKEPALHHQPWLPTAERLKKRYASASFLADRVVIFNVKGNHYRLEVQVACNTGVVVVKWAGTHADYTKRVN